MYAASIFKCGLLLKGFFTCMVDILHSDVCGIGYIFLLDYRVNRKIRLNTFVLICLVNFQKN